MTSLKNPTGFYVPPTSDATSTWLEDQVPSKFNEPSPDKHYHQIVITPFPINETFVDPDALRSILSQNERGWFYNSARFMDMITRQSPRVVNALNLRVDSVLGLPYQINQSSVTTNEKQAKKMVKIVERYWKDYFFCDSVIKLLKQWEIMMGFACAELIWCEVKDKDYGTLLIPTLKPYHPQFFWFNQATKRFTLNTLEGPVEMYPGDPNWLVWNGERAENRPWINGLLRSLGLPETVRILAQRDLARFGEMVSVPAKKVIYNEETYAATKVLMESELNRLSSEATIYIPSVYDEKSGKTERKWDVEYMTVKNKVNLDTSIAMIEKMTDDIEILILGRATQNKSSQFQHKDTTSGIRQDKIESDAVSIEHFMHRMIQEFCLQNFGDETWAPELKFDCQPPEDMSLKSTSIKNIADSLMNLTQIAKDAKVSVDVQTLFESFGIPTK